jgi:ParB family transcriptional regulator, chromosome partitioning protein
MVDENLVRKDISFAEMAMLAMDYAGDPGTATNDPDKAVAVLFKSAGYQKRSYIRSFMTVVDRLGGDLAHPQDIPRSLGLALARKLDETESLAPVIRTALKDWDNRSVSDELAVLRRFASEGAEVHGDEPKPEKRAVRPEKPARARTSFQFDRQEGRGRCLAAVGKLEIQLDRDFTTIDRRRLEKAVRLMLDQLDG